jgi:hypothetical protein
LLFEVIYKLMDGRSPLKALSEKISDLTNFPFIGSKIYKPVYPADIKISLDLIGLRIPRPLGVVRGNRFYQIACSW